MLKVDICNISSCIDKWTGYIDQSLCLRAPVALSTASAGHMEERVQLKLKPTTYIKYAVAVCAVAKHRMKVSSYSSLKVGAAGRMLQDAAGAAAAHKATLPPPAACSPRQQPFIKTFGSYLSNFLLP